MTVRTRIVVVAAVFALVLPGRSFALTAREFATDAGLVAGAPGNPRLGGALLPPGMETGDPDKAYAFEFAQVTAATADDIAKTPDDTENTEAGEPETPYDGPVDEAYGAYQRGLFDAAYEAAMQRAGRGDPRAETLIAELVERKLIAENRAGPPEAWYRMAADSGAPFAVNRYGMFLLGSDDEDERQTGRDLVRQAAEAGDPLAAFNHATILVEEDPGPEGLRSALPWYEMAAEADIADAQYALSQIYRALEGIPEEKRELWRYWLRRAANADHDTAQLDLALALINGTDMPRNLPEGFDWMHRAALNGNAAAASRLAYLYLNGIGTPVDREAAAMFYLTARNVGLKNEEMEQLLSSLSPENRAKVTLRSRAIVRRY
ncbi:tetratricopeptide repeat protein [Martelella mangrovi]|uniref:TPR repeat protein n=1 Tax=Martelella mangrovi TaxID=1397477 RepID=A0ABV2I6L2_9HYPH